MRCPFCREEHPTGTVVCPKTQQRIAGILSEGVVIDKKYKINGVLGTGGMAAVYRAEHIKIGRTVALKLLLPEFVAYPDLVQRVEREARAAGGIDHPNVVEIVDLGTTVEFGPYIAMEMLKGEDLATYAENHGNRLSDVDAADICRQVLAALAAAHEKGVIHRDLKPENIFLADDEDRRRVKVLDFGISKLSEQGGAMSSLTRTGTVMGTPQYMAPEQAAGSRDQDHRVDIYACGVVLYAILTGALPYEAENYNLLINDILNKPPIAILSRDRALDTDLADIVMKAISRNPADRYPTAKAMQDAVSHWLELNSIGNTGTRHKLSDSIRQRIPSSVPARVTASRGSIEVIEQPIDEVGVDEEPTTAIETGDRPKTSPNLRMSHQPTIPATTSPDASSLRSNTRTPLGWENTPSGTKLPPPERRGHPVRNTALFLMVALIGAGAAAREYAPSRWNFAVAQVGMPQLAVRTTAPMPSTVPTPTIPDSLHPASNAHTTHPVAVTPPTTVANVHAPVEPNVADAGVDPTHPPTTTAAVGAHAPVHPVAHPGTAPRGAHPAGNRNARRPAHPVHRPPPHTTIRRRTR